jgi:ketosteroid isomerase-like protein
MTTYAEVFAGIYATVAAHAQCQDAGDTDGIMALYTPDAVLEVPGMGVYQGADVIRAAWDAWKPRKLQRHLPVNIVITGWDDAEARATTDVVFLARGDDGWSVQIVARYHDTFRPAGGQWLLSRRADEYVGPPLTPDT